MLELRGVRKAYGDRVALAGVDLDVRAGSIVGLVGPNGAGKTTLVSIVAGLRRADGGSVRVAGVDLADDPARARALIGLAPQDTGVYPSLTVRDNLRYFAGLAGVARRERRARVESVAAALGLGALLDRRAAELSGGERRRVHTAMALVHEPPLVLLDEPTTGADVRTRAEILAMVRGLAARGSAIVYSTHYLHEIEELAADVAVIDHGRIVARGDAGRLVATHGGSALALTFVGGVPSVACPDGAVVDGSSVRISTDDPAATAAALLPQLGATAGRLRTLEVIQPSLESVFLQLTGRRYADGQDEGSQ
ncbi:MAG TPA: ABC transporter ATP-binding protein [Acidimicrobiia bacterium]|jgi:ABC-2 type transport system ATP-binding protein|nr:ABC transporter ATP-binding protein [Acidimicrobiia bacterium]